MPRPGWQAPEQYTPTERRFVLMFSGVWLIFLGLPIAAVLTSPDDTPTAKAFGVAMIAAFAATYLASFSWPRPIKPLPLPANTFLQTLLLTAFTALAVPTAGPSITGMVPFIMALWMFTHRVLLGMSVAFIIGLAGTFTVFMLADGEAGFSLIAPIFFAGGILTMFRLAFEHTEVERQYSERVALAEQREELACAVHDVHAAGMVSNETFGDRTTADVDAELAVNLASPMHLTRMALPLLRNGRLADVLRDRKRRSDRGSVRSHVVVLGSLGGVLPMPDQAVYAAGKFGLRGAMLSLAMSLRNEGIAVTSVLPSAVDTPMLWREVAEDGNALQFLGPPQTAAEIADSVRGVLGRRVAEVYPNRVDGWLSRAAMLAPNALPAVLPRLEPLGRRGMAKYRAELEARGVLPLPDGRTTDGDHPATRG